MARTRSDSRQYVKLEQRLVLLAWLNGRETRCERVSKGKDEK